mgnify:CR=1 FL=1
MALGIGYVISRYTVEQEEKLREEYERGLADARKTLKEREKVAADARALWEADQKRRASYNYGRPTVHPPVGCRGLAGCMRAAWCCSSRRSMAFRWAGAACRGWCACWARRWRWNWCWTAGPSMPRRRWPGDWSTAW